MNTARALKLFGVITASALLAAACSLNKTATKGSNPANQSAGQETAANGNGEEPSVRGSVMHAIPELKTIHFAYDSANLDAATRAVLAANGKWLKAHRGVKIQVAGHCDQRGTVEYNIALGQRRAAAVRRYYRLLGVPARHIATISFGKEKPACAESTDSCWAQNRRAETLIASPEGISRRN